MLICSAPVGERSGSAAAYALLEYAVGKSYGIPMPAVRKQSGGKPYFPDRPDIHFSLSHAKTHVLCAVSDFPVGVDIETVRHVRQGVAERVCVPDELCAFDFFELWVLKESFLKLSGNTHVSLKSICFKRDGDKIYTPDGGTIARLFYSVHGCRAAVCSKGGSIPAAIELIGDETPLTGC